MVFFFCISPVIATSFTFSLFFFLLEYCYSTLFSSIIILILLGKENNIMSLLLGLT